MFKSSLLAAATAVCALGTPALAASPVTNLFMANVKANAAFLEQSGKLAATRSTSAKVQMFARAEISDSLSVAELLDGVTPVAMVASGSSGDAVLTGRSAASSSSPAPREAANGRPALGENDVADLSRLRGKAFDDALWVKQLDALSQLRADYETYAAAGDDAVLVAVSKRELPKVEAQLLALSKV